MNMYFFEIINGDKTMAKKNDTFKIFFENIKLEDRLPLVFHCTAGKYIFI